MITTHLCGRGVARARLSAIMLLVVVTAASSCGSTSDAAADEARAVVSAPVPISSFEAATYTALVADRAGALHAVWLDRNPETQRQALYHRASADGGRTWGEPTHLSDGQPDGYTGIPGLVADGAGRVYAVWKVVDRATSMTAEELRSSPAFGTLVYRVLAQGRWSPVRALGAERGVVAWFAAADPRGRAHVVWSESPEGSNFLSTTADAGAVRQVELDGATPRGSRVIGGASNAGGKLGYWSLSGYVDAGGVAHWVAVRGNDAERRYLLVHADGARERMLRDYADLAQGAGARTPPQLLLDAAGGEHLVLFEGGRRSQLVDYRPGIAEPRAVIFTGVDADAIQDFQLSSAGGRVVATLQVAGDDGNRLADLFVSTLQGGAWTTPVKVTDNSRLQQQRGVTDTEGRSVGTVKVWSTIHASVVPDGGGALHVLLTNRETSRHVDTRAGGMSGASARSRAYFMTIPNAVAAEPAPAPVARRGTGSANAPAGDDSRAEALREAERLFAKYDITEGGWLSGTELDACACRSADANGDGEVTKAEFIAGVLRRGNASPAAPSERAPDRQETPSPVAPRREPPAAGTGTAAGLPTGRYNCYAYGARRPMPWEPGFGGAAEAPRSTTAYLMNLTIGEGGTYQYLNRGRGSYRLDARSGMIDWRSGPFAGSGIRAAYGRRDDGRPVIYLDLEGTRAYCVGPQS